MFRNALGVLIGIAIVTITTAYGGVGINLLLAVHRDEMPHNSAFSYAITAWYFLGVAFLLLVAAVFTLAEFSNWKIKNQSGLIYATFVLLLALVIVHLVAFFGITSISDQEVKKLFIDGGAPYAVLSIVVVGLFFVIRRIGRAA